MRTIRVIYDVVGWVRSTLKLPVRVDPAVRYIVATVARLKCELSGVVRMQIASFTTNSIAYCSILVSSQQMGWSSVHAGVFGYSRLVREAFDACVLMLLQTCSKPACNLADLRHSAGARHFVDGSS